MDTRLALDPSTPKTQTSLGNVPEPFYPIQGSKSPDWALQIEEDENEGNPFGVMAAVPPAIDGLDLREWYDASKPNRRVEKSELREWLTRVGKAEFLENLDATTQLDDIWDAQRHRNSHLNEARLAEMNVLPGHMLGLIKLVRAW